MPKMPNTTTVPEGMKAAAFILDCPADDLAGYLVIGIKPDADYLISGDVDC